MSAKSNGERKRAFFVFFFSVFYAISPPPSAVTSRRGTYGIYVVARERKRLACDEEKKRITCLVFSRTVYSFAAWLGPTKLFVNITHRGWGLKNSQINKLQEKITGGYCVFRFYRRMVTRWRNSIFFYHFLSNFHCVLCAGIDGVYTDKIVLWQKRLKIII